MSNHTIRERFTHVQRTRWTMSRRGKFWAALYVVGIEPWSWVESALVNTGDNRILGEDDNGVIYAPSKTRPEWWDRRYDWRNPTHWRYWLRSRLTNRVAMLEVDHEVTR